ncbi:hypothetical protein EV680_11930 [Uruburuella suis]|uniref:Uncharacterized protein n=1 Tax=Uruburuella suis TaxID=252130 RepID=A0ABY2C106_9NEIS|nr:hypothetical protein EV680_11930 [Uruburuella suis]
MKNNMISAMHTTHQHPCIKKSSFARQWKNNLLIPRNNAKAWRQQ